MFCCFPVLAVGDILSASAYFWAVFSVWGFVPPLVFEALSSFCWGFVLMLYQGFVLVFYIEASSSYFMLRLCPHILFWGFGLVFYFEASSSYFILRLRPCFILKLCPHILFWGFGLVFYFEASSSYFILRLCPHILFWGFVLIFYIEASSSYFILRLRPRILFRGFVLIFYIEALSSYFILRFRPHDWLRHRPHCYILRLCSSVWGFGRHCCRPLLLCLYCLFGLFQVICVWFCLFVFCLG